MFLFFFSNERARKTQHPAYDDVSDPFIVPTIRFLFPTTTTTRRRHQADEALLAVDGGNVSQEKRKRSTTSFLSSSRFPVVALGALTVGRGGILL